MKTVKGTPITGLTTFSLGRYDFLINETGKAFVENEILFDRNELDLNVHGFVAPALSNQTSNKLLSAVSSREDKGRPLPNGGFVYALEIELSDGNVILQVVTTEYATVDCICIYRAYGIASAVNKNALNDLELNKLEVVDNSHFRPCLEEDTTADKCVYFPKEIHSLSFCYMHHDHIYTGLTIFKDWIEQQCDGLSSLHKFFENGSKVTVYFYRNNIDYAFVVYISDNGARYLLDVFAISELSIDYFTKFMKETWFDYVEQQDVKGFLIDLSEISTI